MAVGRVFFSAAPTAQNSPKLHFPFINYFIQPSRVESLATNALLFLKNVGSIFFSLQQIQIGNVAQDTYLFLLLCDLLLQVVPGRLSFFHNGALSYFL